MATKSKGLGKGLSALIPKANEKVGATDEFFKPTQTPKDEVYFQELPVGKIKAYSKQTRTKFDKDELQELADSIKINGVIQPIIVVPIELDGGICYELVAGERRLRASKLAGKTKIPAIVNTNINSNDHLVKSVIENIQRVDLNPVDEAASYKQLIEDLKVTQDQLSKKIGKSRPYIANSIRILNLPPRTLEKIEKGIISASHAKVLTGLENSKLQEEYTNKIINNSLSVRELETLVKQGKRLEGTQKKLIRKPKVNPEIEAERELIEERLNTDVKIISNKKYGHIQITFASLQDLNRIQKLITNSK